MRTLRLLCLTTVLLAAVVGPATAQQAGAPLPVAPDDSVVAPTPKVEVLRGSSVISAHLVRQADALEACAAGGRAATVKARVKVRWNARGRTRSVAVTGGSKAFRRCAKKALTGVVPIVRRRAGSGRATFVVARPAARAPVAVAAPVTDLQTCQVDADCTLHYQVHACVPGDPVAVNKLDPDAVRATYPVRRLACGMGGPQYTKLRQDQEGRWTARCEQTRCVVR